MHKEANFTTGSFIWTRVKFLCISSTYNETMLKKWHDLRTWGPSTGHNWIGETVHQDFFFWTLEEEMLLNTELQYRWCSRVMVSHTQIIETQIKQILQNALLQTLNNCVVGNQINLLRVRAGFSLGEKIPTVSFPGKKSNIGPKWEPTGAWIRIRQFHAPLCESGSQYG